MTSGAAVAAAAEHVAALRSRASGLAARGPLRRLLDELPEGTLPAGPVTLLGHQHELLVAEAGEGAQAVIVRLARGWGGQRAIAEHKAVLRDLHDDARLEPLLDLVPLLLDSDRSSRWSVEERMPGIAGAALEPSAVQQGRAATVAALRRLHEATAETWVLGPGELDAWVHRPVAAVAAVVDGPEAARGLQRLHARLAAELQDQPVVVARLHGDPSPANVLCEPDGSAVTGLVDWESSAPGLPEVDLLSFLFAVRLADRRVELGDVVVDLVANGWDDVEGALLGRDWSENAHLRPTTLVLLAWLHHVAENLRKTDRYRENRWWVRHNVERVLAALGPGGALDGIEPDGPVTDAPTEPSLEDEVADAAVRAPVRRHRRRPIGVRSLRAALALGTALGWLAWAGGAPVAVRALVALPVVTVGLGAALARCIAVDSALVRTVVAGGGVLAINVLVSELILYAGVWSPGLHLLVIGGMALGLTGLIPRYQAVVRPPPTPRRRDEAEVGA